MSASEADPARRASARAFWDDYAKRDPLIAIYDNAEVRERGEEPFWRAGEADARRLAWFFAPGARVLEIGCGIGRMLRHLAPRCGEIIGVDISAEMLAQGREALKEAPNIRWVHTGGASLPGVADGSVDFVYSLLVMIHVDRRSAFRYLEEVRRVLAPTGLAFLQFQNIACPEGMAKLRAVLDLDYPLEFYTQAELSYLFREVGLDVVACIVEAEYLFYTLTPGDAEAWCARIAAGVTAVEAHPGPTGDLAVRLRSSLSVVQPLRLELGVTRDGRLVRCQDAYLALAPGETRLRIVRAGPDAEASARLDGKPLDLRPVLLPGPEAGATPSGDATFHVALLPPGFLPGEAHNAAFPGLVHAWSAGDSGISNAR